MKDARETRLVPTYRAVMMPTGDFIEVFDCPSCDDLVGVRDHYCSSCGKQLHGKMN